MNLYNIFIHKAFKSCTKVLNLLMSLALVHTCFAMDNRQNAEHEYDKFKSHFEEDKPIIKEALSTLEGAELHFYWTSGYTQGTLKSEYGANVEVLVGGKQYAKQFPIFLDFLLQYSPLNLIVKLTCDPLTLESNKTWLGNLSAKFLGRFLILDIYHIEANMLLAFPDHKLILESIFKNATQGNAAITSDAYRLSAMIFGSDPEPQNYQNKIFSYCDIDTFCNGMTLPNSIARPMPVFDEETNRYRFETRMIEQEGHTNLINALFSPDNPTPKAPKSKMFWDGPDKDPEEAYYIGSRQSSNSLIKLRVTDLSTYKSFCCKTLNIIPQSKEYKDHETTDINLLNYFSKLQEVVKNAEQDSKVAFKNYLSLFSTTTVRADHIIEVTGPGLVNRLAKSDCYCFTFDPEYPDISSMDWHRAHFIDIENRITGERMSGPLDRIKTEASDLPDSVCKTFIHYARRISDAYSIRRFGNQHPFWLQLKAHLYTHFPYATETFKAYLKQVYLAQNSLDKHAWLQEKHTLLTEKSQETANLKDSQLQVFPYYARLKFILNDLGIDRSLLLEDIDFTI